MVAEDIAVAETVAVMKSLVRDWRHQGLTVSLVPTMGALHQGHLDLVRRARLDSDRVVVSIFVNPAQFGPNEDFSRYPRDLKGDLASLASVGVDAVFFPTPALMYPEGFQTAVELTKLPRHLCGLTRQNHFAGVALVVLKLFNICDPDFAVFGLKDFQQVRVIEQMVADLNLDVKIVRYPTVREFDGLAMSSRNAYLTPRQRADALVIIRTLETVAGQIEFGAADVKALIDLAVAAMTAGGGEVEYFRICSPVTLDDADRIVGEMLLVTAVKFGTTRLIDNRLVMAGDVRS